MRYLIATFFVFAMTLSAAFARPPEVAPELNFSNSAIRTAWMRQPNRTDTANPENLAYQERFANEVTKRCPTCHITELKDKYGERKYRVTLSTGWYFEITLDPSVIEIVAKPLTEASLKSMESEMQTLIWDIARDIGLEIPAGYPGHLNFGIESTFGTDPLLFYNFVTDYLNHVGLIKGVLGYRGFENAPHPEELSAAQSRRLQQILATFDPSKATIKDLARSIYNDVYHTSTVFGKGDGEPPNKYHAVNITSLVKEGDLWPRLELRAMPMQHSPEELELLMRLFIARLDFLKKSKTKIEYTAFKDSSPSHEKMVEQFHKYVTEAGLSWDNYRRFVPTSDWGFKNGLESFSNRSKPRSTFCFGLFSTP